VLPYIFLSGTTAVAVSMLFSAVGLFIIGASITLHRPKRDLFRHSTGIVWFGCCGGHLWHRSVDWGEPGRV